MVVAQVDGAEWHSVSLSNPYTNPVVVMQGLSSADSAPAHLRVDQVTPTGFEWQIEEWDYLDGIHATEMGPYLVLEAGVHTLENGQRVEARNQTGVGTAWTQVNFSQNFDTAPILLAGVASATDQAACGVRTRNVSSSGFEVRLQEEEAADGTHGLETVAWVALEAGVGSNGGSPFEAGRTPSAVRQGWYGISFSAAFGVAPVVLVHGESFADSDPAGVRFNNLSSTSMAVKIEEEQSANRETRHGKETVSFLAWGTPGSILSSGSGSSASSSAKPLRSAPPLQFWLEPNYPNPANPITHIPFQLAEGGENQLNGFRFTGTYGEASGSSISRPGSLCAGLRRPG